MKSQTISNKALPVPDLSDLRQAIQEEYKVVAEEPGHGFHFHTGRPLAHILGYHESWLDGILEASVESFAGTGNPFSLGELKPGDRIVDVGCGAGMESLNLMPDKSVALVEMVRVLKPGGRLQIADILVEKPVPEGAKHNIDLWTG